MDSESQAPVSAGVRPTPSWLHRLILVTAVLSFIGMIHGGGVTSTDSAIVDDHWPTFGGAWLPDFGKMLENPYLFLEHNHRLIMATVGLLVIVAAVMLFRLEGQRAAVRRIGLVAASLVVVVGILGGLTVKLGKSPPVSVIHVAIAMMVVVSIWGLVIVTGRKWFEEGIVRDPAETKRLLVFASVALGAIYLQVVLGAVPRHATAEFGGRMMVLVGDAVHILWAFIVFGSVILVYLEVGKNYRKVGHVLRPALLLVVLVVGQVVLGVVTFMEQPKDPPSQNDLRPLVEAAPVPGRAESVGEVESNPGPAEVGTSEPGPRPSTAHVLTASTHQALGFMMLIAALYLTLRVGRIHDLSRRRATEGSRVDDLQAAA